MVMSRHSALSRDEIVRALTSYVGMTTADGAVTKDSLIDANLIGATDWITGKTILIDSGLSEHQEKAASAFDPGTGEITFGSAFTDRIKAGTIFRVLNFGIGGANLAPVLAILSRTLLPSFLEPWLDNVIDLTLWTVINPGSGTPWTTDTSPEGHREAYSIPDAWDIAQIWSNYPVIILPFNFQAESVVRKAVVEFELQLLDVANIDNTDFFIGLALQGDARSWSTNLIGWGLDGGSPQLLQSITKDAVGETTNSGFGETLTNWNKLKVEITYGHVKFFLNEVQVADHVTNFSQNALLLNGYIPTLAGGSATFKIGTTRCWMEDVP